MSADRRAPGADHPRVREADRDCAGALSGRTRTPDDDPGRQRDGSARDHRGDWGRHEPVCDCRTLTVVGRTVSTTQRECRQGHVAPAALRAPWPKPVLVQRAGAPTRQAAQLFPRPVPKAVRPARPEKKAILAVAASILSTAYYVLRNQVPYRDLGPLYFARLDQDRTAPPRTPNQRARLPSRNSKSSLIKCSSC
jgi:hypothetical protein